MLTKEWNNTANVIQCLKKENVIPKRDTAKVGDSKRRVKGTQGRTKSP